MLFPVLLAMVAVQSSCGSTGLQSQTPLTYRYHDHTTGMVLTCDRCPAGFYMSKHCTAATHTVCKTCPQNHFTQDWNYLPSCLYCSTFCGENQKVKEDCSSQNNRVCECEEGFYSDNGLCLRHTECPPGHGMKRRGTPETDTDCEKCPDGKFSSNFSSSAPCADHTDCASLGHRTVLQGTCWHDKMCANSCEDLKDGGEILLIRTFLSDFFSFQKIRTLRLRKLVGKLTSGEEVQQHSRHLLLKILREWVLDATVKDLGNLLLVLRNLRSNKLADRVERKMREIKEAYDCNLENRDATQSHCESDDYPPTESYIL
ncbi:hypothetical protein DPEC_G00050840 [Dallia pectoralis]|uniref:Uncharacterized protein n=1 Tax=Dallia pectoralis TaxID=75939 RepID=A0ACC2HBH4_DALPE|nr:hypothetical protein DPEC_G00050840 [Dallia pectoralis]